MGTKNNRTIRIFLPVVLLVTINNTQAQDYRAINGTPYTGSLTVSNNPASIVHTSSNFDITPFAFQFKQSTNAIIIDSLSFISKKWDNAKVRSVNGTFRRFVMSNQDLRLFNTRIRLNSNSAIAFGLTGRSYLYAKTSSVNGQDSLGNLREFMGINVNNTPVSAEARGQAWAEVFGTYARSFSMYNNSVLNLGITAKLNYGIAGGYITGLGFEEMAGPVNNLPGYYLTKGDLDYGYSSNLDVIDSSSSFKSGKKNFFHNTFSTLGISLGAEYIVPEYETDDNGYGYTMKIGVSLMDLGSNKYKYSNYSRIATLDKPNVYDSLIQTSFQGTAGPESVADTVDMISGTSSIPTGNFKIFQPTRLVINVDKHLIGNLFVNADLTVPISTIIGKRKLVARDMNLFILTPRFETKGFGVYLPASMNTEKHFWIGGAFRAGPLLLGVHNLGNILRKNKMQDGGAYIALTFRFGSNKNDTNPNYDGPKPTGNQLKQLDCPPKVN